MIAYLGMLRKDLSSGTAPPGVWGGVSSLCINGENLEWSLKLSYLSPPRNT